MIYVTSPLQQVSLDYGKAYFHWLEILTLLIFDKKSDGKNTDVKIIKIGAAHYSIASPPLSF